MADLSTLETIRATLGIILAAEQALLGLIMIVGAITNVGNSTPRFALVLGILFISLSGDRWILSPAIASDQTVLDITPFLLSLSCVWLTAAILAGLFFIYFALREFGTQARISEDTLAIIRDTNAKVTDVHQKMEQIVETTDDDPKGS